MPHNDRKKHIKEHRNLIAVDVDTGDVLERMPIYCPPKKHSLFSKTGYTDVSQSAAITLAKSDLSGVTLRVLWMIIASIEMDNYISINQTQMAKEMGLDKSSFNRALKELITNSIVVENIQSGKSKTYSLNPNYGWKGSTKKHMEALEKYEDIRNRNTEISKTVEDDDLIVTVTVKRNKAPGNSNN